MELIRMNHAIYYGLEATGEVTNKFYVTTYEAMQRFYGALV
jgi:hypothetical protein